MVCPNGVYFYNNMAQGLSGSLNTYARFGGPVFGHLFFEDGIELPTLMGYDDDLYLTARIMMLTSV